MKAPIAILRCAIRCFPLTEMPKAILLSCIVASCGAQEQRAGTSPAARVGGPCEGCEAIHEYGERKLAATDTLPDFARRGEKIKVSGTIYKADEKTPAEGVILYVYHTDQDGEYTPGANAEDWEQRHGAIRGWLRTGRDGRYTFYTLRPGSYPSGSTPAHIHATVKEPDRNEYFIDDYFFADDPLLGTAQQRPQRPRGGSGLLRLKDLNGIRESQRDIILGQHIDNY